MMAYLVVLVMGPAVLLSAMFLLEWLRGTRSSHRQVPALRPASAGFVGARIALEAQFYLAPGIAIEEARQMLSRAGVRVHPVLPSLDTPNARRDCFEALLLELDRIAIPSSVRPLVRRARKSPLTSGESK